MRTSDWSSDVCSSDLLFDVFHESGEVLKIAPEGEKLFAGPVNRNSLDYDRTITEFATPAMPGSAPRSAIIRSPAVATILQGRCCHGPDRKGAYAKSQPCVVPVLMCSATLLSKSPKRRRDKRSERFKKQKKTED